MQQCSESSPDRTYPDWWHYKFMVTSFDRSSYCTPFIFPNCNNFLTLPTSLLIPLSAVGLYSRTEVGEKPSELWTPLCSHLYLHTHFHTQASSTLSLLLEEAISPLPFGRPISPRFWISFPFTPSESNSELFTDSCIFNLFPCLLPLSAYKHAQISANSLKINHF